MEDFGPRQSGRTTRLADNCIQEIFTKGFTICRDHFASIEMNLYLFDIVYDRLRREHQFSLGRLIINRNDKYITTKEWESKIKDILAKEKLKLKHKYESR